MGVPKFAAWLSKKYPAMVMDKCPDDVHGLYIDLNGLIHPCCHDEHDATVALRSEVEKMRSICLAIETLVVTVRPQRVLYIAIDGVAPRAKMNQQRARRYMSAGTPLTNTEKPIHGSGGSHEISAGVVAAIEKEFTAAEKNGAERDLEDVSRALLGDVLYGGASVEAEEGTAGVSFPTLPPAGSAPTATSSTCAAAGIADVDDDESERAARFDSNCISPGTEFMEKVAAAVRDFVKRKLAAGDDSGTDPLSVASPATVVGGASSPWTGLTVVFSDSNTAGEGEHKFLDFLRTQSAFPGFNGSGCHVIAGLDADLIFLSLSLHIPRVVILRDHDRSSYDKALLPVSAGGTLVPPKAKDTNAHAAESYMRSDSTSSVDTAVVAAVTPTSTMTMTTEVVDVTNGATTPAPSDVIDDFARSESTAAAAAGDGGGGTLSSSSAVSSPLASPAPPPHIASVVADLCSSYEYYDVDVVGASIVSEVYQLCLEKKMQVVGNPLENLANCVAANGFNFYNSHSSGSAHGAAAASQLPPFHPCTSPSNSKIIDDFVVLGMLLGNDFLPRSPSVYCGESAMDTLLDVYVSAVLPHGYLTGGNYEIQLLQLERFLRAYSAVEALRFRQYAIQANRMTPQEAATAVVYSEADRRCWRDTYVRTTTLRDEAGVQAACRSYVEGLRFVWRYYSSISLQVSWSWHYPFHHAPLARDVADFLKAQGPNVQATLAPPRLERLPPPPFCQLLCILPPTSRRLVPAVLRLPMLQPPPELVSTFPTSWTVDFTGAYGKDHLAAVLLPFANLPHLQALVADCAGSFTAAETARNTLRSTHLVIESRDAATVTGGAADAAVSKASGAERDRPRRGAPPAAAAGRVRGFSVQGGGLQPLAESDLPAELQGCPSLLCRSLADVVPPLSRPRTYSHTVAIPGLTVLPDGSRVPAERRPPSRFGNRRGRGNAGGRNGKDEKSKADGGGGGSAASGGHAERPSMLFGEFAAALGAVAFLTAMAVVLSGGVSAALSSACALMQVCAVALGALGLAFALGLAVASKGRVPGSGLHRHNIFTAFADWQCAVCLSLNFSRNRRCFVCRAPFDSQRCTALFSGRNPPEPPLMDPDHGAYAASYGIMSM